MLIVILQHTPVWVWGLLVVLIALGLSQVRDREVTLVRATILPLVMIVLSASGVLSAFGLMPIALGGWLAGVGAALALGRQVLSVHGARWLAQRRMLHVPGSWLPLALIVVLFAVKYFVGVSVSMNPTLAHQGSFAGLAGLAYGAFSGVFLARGLSLRGVATQRDSLSPA